MTGNRLARWAAWPFKVLALAAFVIAAVARERWHGRLEGDEIRTERRRR